MHPFFDALTRWYLGGFMLVFGVVLVIRARALNDLKRYFRCDELTPAFAASVERRAEREAMPASLWRISGVVFAVVGLAVLCGLLSGVVGYAISTLFFALSLAAAFARLRNGSPRRAAALTPRSLGMSIPPVWLAAAAVAALTPLVLVIEAPYRAAAVIVTFAGLATFASTLLASTMPSLMDGEDVAYETAIDARLRERRVRGLFTLSLGVPFMFFAMVDPAVGPGLWHGLAYTYCALAWGAYQVLGLRVRIARAPLT